MNLRETEVLMCQAAREQKNIVVVDRDGKTYRGIARAFADWYRMEDGYAALLLEPEETDDEWLSSKDILYIELHG